MTAASALQNYKNSEYYATLPQAQKSPGALFTNMDK